MKAHVIVDNMVVNTIIVEDLDFPVEKGELIDGETGAIGWGYVDGHLVPPAEPPLTAAAAVAGMEAFYDAEAQTQNYDNRYTCAMRAGYPGPFQAQGAAFGTWMDTCNAIAYGVLAQVEGGQVSAPTLDELLAMFPEMVWPA